MTLTLSPQQLLELEELYSLENGYVFARKKGGQRLIAHDGLEVWGYTELVDRGWKAWWRSKRNGRWIKEPTSPTKEGAETRLRNRVSKYPPLD
jgi:hypothetical protein